MVPCNFWKRPQALQRVFPSGLLLQSGVLKVLQLKHCIRGFLFCPDGSILDILEDTEAALLKLARDVDDIGLISEFFQNLLCWMKIILSNRSSSEKDAGYHYCCYYYYW